MPDRNLHGPLFGSSQVNVTASDGYNEDLFAFLISFVLFLPIVIAFAFTVFEVASPVVFAWRTDALLRKADGASGPL